MTITRKSTTEAEYSHKKKPLTDFPFRLVKYLVERFELRNKVADVMCGRGEHAQAFDELGLDVWCVDMSPAAAQVLGGRNDRLLLCNVDEKALPFEDNSLDVVFCKSAIEHVNADRLVSEFYRILKPGGKVIILTGDWFYNYRFWYTDHTHGYGCPWMKPSMKLILETYGFRDIVVENILYLPFTWNNRWGKKLCALIRLFPYPQTDNFTSPLWKIVRFSNEVQLLGVGVK